MNLHLLPSLWTLAPTEAELVKMANSYKCQNPAQNNGTTSVVFTFTGKHLSDFFQTWKWCLLCFHRKIQFKRFEVFSFSSLGAPSTAPLQSLLHPTLLKCWMEPPTHTKDFAEVSPGGGTKRKCLFWPFWHFDQMVVLEKTTTTTLIDICPIDVTTSNFRPVCWTWPEFDSWWKVFGVYHITSSAAVFVYSAVKVLRLSCAYVTDRQ